VNRTRFRSRFLLPLLAVLSLATGVGLPTQAGAAPTSLRAQLDLNSPATIQSGSAAGFTLHWSVNDGPSPQTTIAMTLPEGVSIAPGSGGTVKLPDACIDGSSIAPDGRSFECELGPKAEGTWGAFDLNLAFGGSNGEDFDVAFDLTDGTITTPSNTQTVTVTATPQAELLKGFRQGTSQAGAPAEPYILGIENVTDQNGVPGRALWYPIRIEVPVGGEPITDVTFTDDWSDLQAAWPNIRPIDFTVAKTPNQQNCAPWDIAGWAPYGEAGINPDANLGNSPANSGTWSCNVTGSTTQVTISDISTNPSLAPGSYGSSHRTVAIGALGFFVPLSDIPFGTSAGDNVVNNIVMTTKSGATAADANTPNNTSPTGITRLNPGFGDAATAGWTQDIAYYEATPASSVFTGTIGNVSRWTESTGSFDSSLSPTFAPRLSGNYSNRYDMMPNVTSNGSDLANPGDTLYATTQFTLSNQSPRNPADMATCTKWDTNLATLAPAPSTVDKFDIDFETISQPSRQANRSASTISAPGVNPAHPFAMANMIDYEVLSEGFNLRQNLVSGLVYGTDYVIQYGRIANPSTGDCGNAASAGGWHEDPADVTGGPVNAVRAITLGDQAPPAGDDYRWTLDVPLELTGSAAAGDIIPFWSVRKLLPAQPSGGPAPAIDDVWVGEGAYNPTTHGGDARYGSRLRIANASLSIDKTSNLGDTFAVKPGDEVDFEITVGIHGDGSVPLVVEDLLANGMTYVPGSATITTSGGLSISPPTEPVVGAPPFYLASLIGSQLNWNLGTISGANDETVTITYTAVVDNDAPIGSTGYNIAIGRGGENTGGASAITPTAPNGVVGTLAFQFSNAYWELNVTKEAGPSPIFPGEDATYSLNYANSGTRPAESVTFIDVFPFNGDDSAPALGEDEIGREVGSSFSGTLTLASASGSDERFLYTTADPATISLDPLDATNLPGTGSTVWCQPVGGTMPLFGFFGDPGCPASLADATAVRFTTGAALAPGQSRTVDLVFNTAGNFDGDRYTNNFGGRVDPPSNGSTVPVTMGWSNDVTIDVRALRLGDYVWLDADRDGIQDSDEDPIEGVTVELLDDGGAVIGTTTTDADGLYIFENLVPGDYTVRFTPPAGMIATVATAGSDTEVDSNPTGGLAPVTLTGNEVNDENLTIDAGFYPLLSLGNYTWFDIDRDGVQDAGEPPLEGVVVTLTDNNGDPVVDGFGNPVGPQTTGPDGLYLFENLVSDLYVVSFAPPASYTFTDQAQGGDTDADSDADPDLGVAQVLLEEDRLDIDAGFIRPVATIGNYVWFDADLDGIQDASEDPVEGVTATLTDDNGDPVVDIDGNPVAPQATDADGLYLFTNLAPGTYTVTFTDLPAGFVVTQTGAGSDPAVDSNGLTATTTVGAFEEDLTLDLGIYRLVSVGDYVWLDADRDGIQDASEAPVPNVTVTLLDADGDEVATTTTDADGLYLFEDLNPGAYTIVFSDLPAGLSFTQQNAGGDDDVDSDADPADGSVSFNLPDDRRDIDAGLVPALVSIGDYVWFDHNRNGIQDSTENPVEDVTVNLLDANGDVVATTTTDADGFYSFGDLEPSTGYAVEFVAPSGYHFTVQGAQSDPTVDSNADPDTGIALVTTPADGSNSLTNPDDPTIDAGFVRLDLTLTKDLVSSGPFYIGDPVTFELTPRNEGPSDALSGWSVTDVLPSGMFVLSIDGPGYDCDLATLTCTSSSPLAAGEDGEVITVEAVIVAENANLTNVAYITPGPGEVTEDVPLGTPPTGPVDTDNTPTNNDDSATVQVGELVSVGDYTWLDVNRDGVQDPDEPPVAGINVLLFNSSGSQVGATVTDGAGYYSFIDLEPGDYRIVFQDPNGLQPTVSNAGGDGELDSDPDADGSVNIALTVDRLDIDAGFVTPPVSIGDYVWFDHNRNGIQDSGENPVEDVTVNLLDANGDVVATTTTDADGFYSFGDLEPSTAYVVEFVAPSGYSFTVAGAQSDPTVDSNADPATGLAPVTTPASGSNSLTNPDDPTIDAGFVRIDLTLTKELVSSGPFYPGDQVTFHLTPRNEGPSDALSGWSVTDVLPSGLTLVLIVGSADYTCDEATFTCTSSVPLAAGEDGDAITVTATIDSDASGTLNNVAYVTPAPGEITEDVPLGTPPTSGTDTDASTTNNDDSAPVAIEDFVSVGDYVWLDANRDGVQDPDEDPVPGVTVTLLDADGDEVATTTTDADGLYLFDGLIPGDYSIVFSDLPSGLSFTGQNAGSDDAVDSDPDTDGSVSFTLNQDRLDIDAGLVRPLVSIGDYVWFDHNRNGIQDSAENPVEDVTVNLVDANGDVVATTTTDADGFYSFGDLEPSTGYAVEFVAPSGYHFTVQGAQSDPTVDSNADPATGIALVISPADGSNSLTNPDDPTIDAGFVRLDLTLTKELVSSGPFYLGDEVTFELTPRNEGPSDALSGWSVTDVLPAGLELVSIDGSGYTCDAGTLTCTSASPLAAGADGEVITVVATITETDTTLTNVAYVTPAPGEVTEDVPLGTPPTSGTDTDASTTNNDDSVPVVVSPLVSLGNYTWIDSNRDGIQDPSEAPLPGVVVVLLDSDGDEVATTTTDADGLYLFSDLLPGDYTVTFTQPAGYTLTSSGEGSDTDVDSDPASDGTVDVTLTTDRLDIDAGFWPPAVSLGNYVWFDDNYDGIQDSDEDPVPGVTVTLIDADGNPVVDNQGNTVAPAVTDADGLYLFSDLPPGDYSVVFSDLPAGTAITLTGAGSDTAADSNGLIASTSLPNNGDEDLTLDLGLVRLAAIGDRVWFDIDRDGFQDEGEDNVPGVTVTLTDSDGNVVDTTVTDGDGRYLFDGLFPGDYRVTFSDLPADYEVTTTEATGDTSMDSNGLSSVKVALAAGETDLTYDLGLWLPASVGDFVWLDANADGIQDQGEAPVPGVTVTLLDADGNELATTTTDTDGAYLFDGLVPGDYLVRFTAPDGYVISPTNIGSDTAVDSDGITTAVTLDAGEHDPTIDLGLYRPASLGDFVWLDMDADGIQDQGEAPVPGVTVTLLDADGNELDTTTTDADGAYLFDGLAPGTYTVTFSDLPADHVITATGAGSDITVDSNGLTTTVTLAENEHNPTIDLGLYPLAAIGDRVWFDLDRDGFQDEGEDSTPGVTVTLLDGDGNEVATTTTDADGRYLFDGLRPGDYTVVFSDLPADYEVTTTEATGDTSMDSNGLSSVKVALAAGETDLTYDLGLWLPASVGDFVWLDANADGIQDQGEAPVPGVTVTLLDADGNELATTTTDTDGAYLFDGLVPGDYTVTFTVPDGYVTSPTDAGDDDAADSDGTSVDVNLEPGEHDPTIDLGLYRPASLGDFVWLDADRDGIQDEGEAPVPGVTVTLLDAEGNELATTTTDADGAYLFDGLAPGTYTVTFSDLPAGLVVTTTRVGDDRAIDSNGLTTVDITLAEGEHNPTIDLGLYRPTIDIELVKFVNGDDANEAPGITVDGGSEVTWTYEITNTGEVDLVDLTLVDDIEGDVVCPQNTLAVGETITCTLKGVAIEGPYTNVGTVTGTNVDDPSETVTDDDPANYTGLVDEEPTTTTTTTVPTTPTTTTPPADVDQNVTQRNPLVRTGSDVLVLVLIGGALLAGGFLILGARRRRSAGEA
jgi:uncharacterized repeat protein (TIGR01451 family)/fimbrial isopeptide formation D2 family protein